MLSPVLIMMTDNNTNDVQPDIDHNEVDTAGADKAGNIFALDGLGGLLAGAMGAVGPTSGPVGIIGGVASSLIRPDDAGATTEAPEQGDEGDSATD